MAKRPSNRLKNESLPDKEKEEVVAKKAAKEPEEKETPSGPFMQRLKDGMEKYKVSQLSGLFLILFSVCLLLAFTSFMFTWQVDYDKVTGSLTSLLSPNVKTANWLGNFGARLSYVFINNWFGIAAYGFALIFFVMGAKLLLNVTLLPIAKTLRITLFLMIWTSVMMGYIFNKNYLFMGGGVGYFSATWLDGVIGRIGTLLSLLFVGTAFLLVNNLVKIPSFKKAEKPEAVLETEEEETEEEEDEKHDIEEPFIKNDRTKNTVKEVIPPPPTPVTAPIEFSVAPEKPVEEKKSPEPKKVEGVEFSIEKAPEVKVEPVTVEEEPKEISSSPYDPTLDLSDYKFPPLSLLQDYGKETVQIDQEELTANKDRIVATLANYSIGIKKIKATPGPTVTLYEIVPQDGTRISKIKNLEDDIALSLSALGIRIIAPMPGQGTIGIEVPNRNPVWFL